MARAFAGRNIERSTITALVPVAVLVPFWLVAMLVIWLPVRVVTDVPYWAFPVGWLIIGVALLVPSIQVAVLGAMLGARRLDPDEHDALLPRWQQIVHDAGFPRHQFELRIIDADELNAFACGGNLVIVTTFAVDRLTDRQLAGVLAHELSHHLGLHTVALTLAHWLSLPIVMLARFGFFLQNVARAATEAFVSHSAALSAIGQLVAGAMWAISWVFLAALHAADALGNLLGHRSEFEADHRTVELGYGRHLSEALRVVMQLGGGERPVGWRARLAASHPPARTRAARIDALLRQRRS